MSTEAPKVEGDSRCGAKTCTGTHCQSPVMPTVCVAYTAEAIAKRRQARAEQRWDNDDDWRIF